MKRVPFRLDSAVQESDTISLTLVSACVHAQKTYHIGADEMAQRVQGLAAKPDHLSSIPRIHTVEGGSNSCKWF